MRVLAASTPILVFFELLALMWIWRRQHEAHPDLRLTFILASAFWGGLVVAFTEIPSLFAGLQVPWLGLLWGATFVVAAFAIWRASKAFTDLHILRDISQQIAGIRGWERVLAVVLLAMIALLGLVAFVSPSNNTDALRYHMPRVVHWAQYGGVRHYATAYRPQLTNPYWPELTATSFHILRGNDQIAGLIQWFSMIGCLMAVSYIAKLLGAGQNGQWLSVIFAFSLPIGILQSTSTQTDYVTAFWLVGLLMLTTLCAQRKLDRVELAGLTLTVGLGLLTKATFYLYSPPMLLWYVLVRLRQNPLRKVAGQAFIMGWGVGLLNLGYWWRNMSTFGGIWGPSSWVGATTGARLRPGDILRSFLQQISFNIATPSEGINDRVLDWINHLLHNLGSAQLSTRIVWLWNHEDLAGNPIHLIIIAGALLAIWAVAAFRSQRSIREYSLVLIGSAVLFSIVIIPNQYTVRWQLPLFVASAPLVGVVIGGRAARPAGMYLMWGLLALSIPWLLFNRTRPVVSWKPRTAVDSVFISPKSKVLFANWTGWHDPSLEAVEIVREAGCERVGLRLDSHDLEYAFWWLLDAPQSGVQIETLYTFPELSRYIDKTFEPCSVICTICGDRLTYGGLERIWSSDQLSVFLSPDLAAGFIRDNGG